MLLSNNEFELLTESFTNCASWTLQNIHIVRSVNFYSERSQIIWVKCSRSEQNEGPRLASESSIRLVRVNYSLLINNHFTPKDVGIL